MKLRRRGFHAVLVDSLGVLRNSDLRTVIHPFKSTDAKLGPCTLTQSSEERPVFLEAPFNQHRSKDLRSPTLLWWCCQWSIITTHGNRLNRPNVFCTTVLCTTSYSALSRLQHRLVMFISIVRFDIWKLEIKPWTDQGKYLASLLSNLKDSFYLNTTTSNICLWWGQT